MINVCNNEAQLLLGQLALLSKLVMLYWNFENFNRRKVT